MFLLQGLIRSPASGLFGLLIVWTLWTTCKRAGYNRANYFENLHLKQSRNFRKQQIVHSQVPFWEPPMAITVGILISDHIFALPFSLPL